MEPQENNKIHHSDVKFFNNAKLKYESSLTGIIDRRGRGRNNQT